MSMRLFLWFLGSYMFLYWSQMLILSCVLRDFTIFCILTHFFQLYFCSDHLLLVPQSHNSSFSHSILAQYFFSQLKAPSHSSQSSPPMAKLGPPKTSSPNGHKWYQLLFHKHWASSLQFSPRIVLIGRLFIFIRLVFVVFREDALKICCQSECWLRGEC